MEREAPVILTIAELAERAGTTRRTIRYYVSEGLLPPPGGQGQRRVYTMDHLLRLRAIQRMKEAFLPLREIRRRLARMTPDEVRRLAHPSAEEPQRDRLAQVATLLATVSPPGATPIGAAPGLGASYVASQLDQTIHRSIRPIQTSLRGVGTSSPEETTPIELDATADDIWHRVTLAPGVELHYQPSRDRRRHEAIAHLIRAAMSLLATAPPTAEQKTARDARTD